jgi:hypothetical protein
MEKSTVAACVSEPSSSKESGIVTPLTDSEINRIWWSDLKILLILSGMVITLVSKRMCLCFPVFNLVAMLTSI